MQRAVLVLAEPCSPRHTAAGCREKQECHFFDEEDFSRDFSGKIDEDTLSTIDSLSAELSELLSGNFNKTDPRYLAKEFSRFYHSL